MSFFFFNKFSKPDWNSDFSIRHLLVWFNWLVGFLCVCLLTFYIFKTLTTYIGVYEKSLYLLPSFALNVNLLEKIKSSKKKKIASLLKMFSMTTLAWCNTAQKVLLYYARIITKIGSFLFFIISNKSMRHISVSCFDYLLLKIFIFIITFFLWASDTSFYLWVWCNINFSFLVSLWPVGS